MISSPRFTTLLQVLLFICLLAMQSAPVASQTNAKISKPKPDLTGSWLFDRQKSNVRLGAAADRPLKITHKDPELRIAHRIEKNGVLTDHDFVYYTDGRGEENPTTVFLATATTMNQAGPATDMTKSRTTWSGDKLVTRSTLRSVIAGQQLEFEVVDEWKLSKDGNVLTETSKTIYRQDSSNGVFIPADGPVTKKVYNRVPD